MVKAFLIDWPGFLSHDMKGILKIPPGTPPPLTTVTVEAVNGKCLKYSRCMQHLSSPPFWLKSTLLSASLSPPGVYDEDSQWIIQVNRLQKLIDRLEQKVTWPFAQPFQSPLLPTFFLWVSFWHFLFRIFLLSLFQPSELCIIFWN